MYVFIPKGGGVIKVLMDKLRYKLKLGVRFSARYKPGHHI